MSYDKCLEKLKNNNLKITPRRKAIIDLMINNNSLFSAIDIYNKLKRKFKKLGLPSIYRNLEELRNIGLITKIQKEGPVMYYTLCNIPRDKHHHHFICLSCSSVEPIFVCQIDDILPKIEKNLQCKVNSHSLQIEGFCRKCVNI